MSRRAGSLLAAVLLAATGCMPGQGGTGSDPDGQAGPTIENCGYEVPAGEPPERVFAAYQPAIEMAHALGISDRLVATAFLDAEVLPEYAEAQREQTYYPELPSRETVLGEEPDFVLSGFNGAFTDEHFGTRASLRELGMDSWVFSPLCPSADGLGDETIDPAAVTMEAVYRDLRDLGRLFDVEQRAEEIVAEMQQTIAEVTDTLEAGDGDTPSVAVGRLGTDGFNVAGGPDFSTELIALAGGENAFGDLDDERNLEVSVEELIARDPDHIFVPVCCDAEMTAADAADDVAEIESDPALAGLEAVAEDNVHEFLFADRSAGVRSAGVVAELARDIHPELF